MLQLQLDDWYTVITIYLVFGKHSSQNAIIVNIYLNKLQKILYCS